MREVPCGALNEGMMGCEGGAACSCRGNDRRRPINTKWQKGDTGSKNNSIAHLIAVPHGL